MKINYHLLLFIYAPVLLLLLISVFKDRFEHPNNALKRCNWSLLPGTVVIFFTLSGEIIKSLWYVNLIPILKNFSYNPFNFEVFVFFYYCLILIIVYVFLKYIHNTSIVEVFDLKFIQFPFIMKVCGILAVINIFSIYLLDLNLLLNPQESVMETIKLLDTKHIILFSFVTIVVAPIVEESIFRGLLYAPLYRKVGRRLAIILSSLIWAYIHFDVLYPSIQIGIVGIFVIGVFLAWLYDRSGSLIHPIVFHMFKNSWILLYIVGG